MYLGTELLGRVVGGLCAVSLSLDMCLGTELLGRVVGGLCAVS